MPRHFNFCAASLGPPSLSASFVSTKALAQSSSRRLWMPLADSYCICSRRPTPPPTTCAFSVRLPQWIASFACRGRSPGWSRPPRRCMSKRNTRRTARSWRRHRRAQYACPRAHPSQQAGGQQQRHGRRTHGHEQLHPRGACLSLAARSPSL